MRLHRVGARTRFDAVPTSGPVQHPNELAKERARQSIETQFSVNRRVLVPAILTLMILFGGLPFLGDVPKAMVTLLGAAITVFLGVAARPFVENAIAGLVISGSRLVSIGDTVEIDDIYGTVEDITTTHTTVKIWDWRRYLVPNTRMLQTCLTNYSLNDRYLWKNVEFYVAPGTDLEMVRALAIDCAQRSAHFAEHEPPECWVMELKPEWVRLMVAAWADTPSQAWLLGDDIRSALSRELAARGIASQLSSHRMVGPPPSELLA